MYEILFLLFIWRETFWFFPLLSNMYRIYYILIHINFFLQVDIWEERKVFNPRGQTLKEDLLGRSKNGKNISYKLVRLILLPENEMSLCHNSSYVFFDC